MHQADPKRLDSTLTLSTRTLSTLVPLVYAYKIIQFTVNQQITQWTLLLKATPTIG